VLQQRKVTPVIKGQQVSSINRNQNDNPLLIIMNTPQKELRSIYTNYGLGFLIIGLMLVAASAFGQ